VSPTKLERITHLGEPPVIGRRYLVPTVHYVWLHGSRRAWPVYLPKHDDQEHLNFPFPHYHVDPRFLNKRDTRFAAQSSVGALTSVREGEVVSLAERTTQARPLVRTTGAWSLADIDPHPPIVWAAKRCFRPAVGYRAAHEPTIVGMHAAYQGQQCRRVRSGWICPHKRFPLGSLEPVDGVVTCPLHGLRVRVSDGVVL
jgi:hypothetical protein